MKQNNFLFIFIQALNAARIESQMNISRILMEQKAQKDIAVQQALAQARADMQDKIDTITVIAEGSSTVISDDKGVYNVSWNPSSSGQGGIATIMDSTSSGQGSISTIMDATSSAQGSIATIMDGTSSGQGITTIMDSTTSSQPSISAIMDTGVVVEEDVEEK